jgi:hypothetical protein
MNSLRKEPKCGDPIGPFDMQLVLPQTGTRQQQVYRAIRDTILAGHLASGTRLPSTRNLAADLSRVIQARSSSSMARNKRSTSSAAFSSIPMTRC